MGERFSFEDDFEVFVDDDDLQWNDDYAPPYHEELDFDKDPVTEYLPEEQDIEDEAE